MRVVAHGLSPTPSVKGLQVRSPKLDLPPVPLPLPRGPYSQLPQRSQEPEPLETPDISSSAFHSAIEQSRPEILQNLPGVQELSSALWARRSIPSCGDAVMHMFQDFDTNNDGVLSAEEISAAFALHRVELPANRVEELLTEYLGEPSKLVTRENWPGFIHGLATGDLHTKYREPSGSGSDEPASSQSSLDG